MDKFLALNMFVETVRCGGYSAAARKLGIATSSVTRQVAALEAELGAALLNRSTRHNSPTDAGAVYFERVVAILEAVANADSLVSDRAGEARGRLRISVPVEFGRRVIAPHMGRFLAKYPALEVSLNLSDEIIDLSKERVDLSVRLGTAVSSEDIVCKPVGQFERWIVASPGYLVQTRLPMTPHDLLDHSCLRFDYGSVQQGWQFRQGDEQFSVPVMGRLQSNNADILREAALEGQGLTLLADWLVMDDVREGKLTRVLSDFQVNPGNANATINVMFLPNHRGSSRIKVFVEFLQELLTHR